MFERDRCLEVTHTYAPLRSVAVPRQGELHACVFFGSRAGFCVAGVGWASLRRLMRNCRVCEKLFSFEDERGFSKVESL
jgi:hypothetical protein